ncbi:MAG: hypothetical protein AAF823_04095 [Planctomycetota bacterium]
MNAAIGSVVGLDEVWQFEVDAPQACSVCLVRETKAGVTQWVRMTRAATGLWTALVSRQDGDAGFSYVMGQGETFINCGRSGLTAKRVA